MATGGGGRGWLFLKRNDGYAQARPPFAGGAPAFLDAPFPLRRQTEADLEAGPWGLLAWEDPFAAPGPCSPFWSVAPMIEAAPAPADGPGLAEIARESGATLEGLMLEDGTLILKVERAGRARQVRIADGARFDPWRGSFVPGRASGATGRASTGMCAICGGCSAARPLPWAGGRGQGASHCARREKGREDGAPNRRGDLGREAGRRGLVPGLPAGPDGAPTPQARPLPARRRLAGAGEVRRFGQNRMGGPSALRSRAGRIRGGAGVWTARLVASWAREVRPGDQDILGPVDPGTVCNRGAPSSESTLDGRPAPALEPLRRILAVRLDEGVGDGVDEVGVRGHVALPCEALLRGTSMALSEPFRCALRPLTSTPDGDAAAVCRTLRDEDVPVRRCSRETAESCRKAGPRHEAAVRADCGTCGYSETKDGKGADQPAKVLSSVRR